MATYQYDDGSTITTDGVSVSSTPSNDAPYYYGWSTDTREAAKLNDFVFTPPGDTRPWYERVAEFGLTRAIDAHFGPAATNKGSAQASYAGQNGQTYPQSGLAITPGMLMLGVVLVGALMLMND